MRDAAWIKVEYLYKQWSVMVNGCGKRRNRFNFFVKLK